MVPSSLPSLRTAEDPPPLPVPRQKRGQARHALTSVALAFWASHLPARGRLTGTAAPAAGDGSSHTAGQRPAPGDLTVAQPAGTAPASASRCASAARGPARGVRELLRALCVPWERDAMAVLSRRLHGGLGASCSGASGPLRTASFIVPVGSQPCGRDRQTSAIPKATQRVGPPRLGRAGENPGAQAAAGGRWFAVLTVGPRERPEPPAEAAP